MEKRIHSRKSPKEDLRLRKSAHNVLNKWKYKGASYLRTKHPYESRQQGPKSKQPPCIRFIKVVQNEHHTSSKNVIRYETALMLFDSTVFKCFEKSMLNGEFYVDKIIFSDKSYINLYSVLNKQNIKDWLIFQSDDRSQVQLYSLYWDCVHWRWRNCKRCAGRNERYVAICLENLPWKTNQLTLLERHTPQILFWIGWNHEFFSNRIAS